MTRKGVMILLALGALAAATAALGATARGWQILWVTPNAKGAEFEVTAVADDGSFAGNLMAADRSKRVLFYNGKVIADIGAKIGPGSVAYGMNNRHQIVGERSTERDLSSQRHAFVWSGGRSSRVLAQVSRANAINDAGVVVGSFLAPDEKQHAFAWSTGGLKWGPVKKGFVDLGLGTAVSINNPSTSWNVQIVGSVDASAGYYTLNLRTLKFKAQKLSFQGQLNAVNTAGRAGGYRVSPSRNLLPVFVNLRTKAVTTPSVPAPFTDGQINAVSEGGDAFGQIGDPSGNLQAVKWTKGKGAPVRLTNLFTKKQLRAGTLTNAIDASATGLVAGTGIVSAAGSGYVASPSASAKLEQLLVMIRQTSPKIFAKGTRPAISKAFGAAKRNASPCAQVDKAVKANYADLRKVGFYTRNALVDALDEVKYTASCPGKIRTPRGMPFLFQR